MYERTNSNPVLSHAGGGRQRNPPERSGVSRKWSEQKRSKKRDFSLPLRSHLLAILVLSLMNTSLSLLSAMSKCCYFYIREHRCSIIANRKLITRFLTSYRWSAYVTPNSRSPQRVTQKTNLSFLWIKFKFNRIKSVTKFLCVKTSSSKVVVEPFLYPTVYKYRR